MTFLSNFLTRGFVPQLVRFYSSTSELLHPSFQTPKDAPIWPLNKPLPRGAWVSYLLDSPHQERFWEDLQLVFAQLHPNTAYAMLFHPSSARGMVTLGNSILVDRNSDLSTIRAHLKAILTLHEENYEEDFVYTCQVKVKEIASQVPDAPSTTSITLAPIEAGPQVNTITMRGHSIPRTPQSSTTDPILTSNNRIEATLQTQTTLLNHIANSFITQTRRSVGYERLAETKSLPWNLT